MRKNVLVSASLVIVSILLIASFVPVESAITFGRWRDIDPINYSPDVNGILRGVYVRNGGTGSIGAGDGWAVGGSTGPLISHYDGFSWQILASPVTAGRFTSVHFCTSPSAPGVGLCSPNGDGSDGWIVGWDQGSGQGTAVYWDGAALTIVNAGLTSSVNLTSVFLACHSPPYGAGCSSVSSTGLAVAVGKNSTGGSIYQFNGNPKSGGGWTEQAVTGVSTTQYNSVYLYYTGSGLGGFAVGNNGVIAQLFGGAWVAIQPPSMVGYDLLSVFVDSGNPIHAWAVSRAGKIWKFLNGAWAGPLSPSPSTTADLTSIILTSTSEGWIVGTTGIILHSTTLGSSDSWAPLQQPLQTAVGSGVNLLGVSFPGGGNGWAVGSAGIIIHTENSGCGSSVSSPCWGGSSSITESPQLNAVVELGSSDAWAGGRLDTVSNLPSLIHWDGNKWHRASVVPLNVGTDVNVWGIYMVGGSEGWAVGGNTAGTTPEALRWDGNTWAGQPITSCGGGSCLPKSVYIISGGTGGDGWIVGTACKIWRYQSGSWGLFGSPVGCTEDLNSVFIFNPGSSNAAGYAVGNSGRVLKLTVTGGIPTWSIVGIPGITSQNLYSVYFKDSTHGWIMGDSATIVSTSDGGTTWSGGTGQVTGAPGTTVLRSVSIDTYGTGSGNGDGWAVGDDGAGNLIFAHWDGVSWTNTPLAPPIGVTPTGLELYSVYVRGPEDGFAVGRPVHTGTLAGIFHLDPLNPPTSGGSGGGGGGGGSTSTSTSVTTSIATSTTSATSSSTSNTESTSSTQVSSSQVSTSQASASATSQVASSTSSSSATSMSTVTVTASSSSQTTPLVVPAVPGYPLESIVAGIIIGLSVLVVLRQRRRSTTT
jgi:photosystem II stability/assembly factor-like uncharacterized protein